LQDHRQGIVSEVRVVLSAYFQPSETPETITAQLAWWADELHDWTREQVVWGLRQWNRDNPSKRPTPGHILKILKDARGKAEAERMRLSKPAPETQAGQVSEDQKRVNAEVANGILKQFGFRP